MQLWCRLPLDLLHSPNRRGAGFQRPTPSMAVTLYAGDATVVVVLCSRGPPPHVLFLDGLYCPSLHPVHAPLTSRHLGSCFFGVENSLVLPIGQRQEASRSVVGEYSHVYRAGLGNNLCPSVLLVVETRAFPLSSLSQLSLVGSSPKPQASRQEQVAYCSDMNLPRCYPQGAGLQKTQLHGESFWAVEGTPDQ